MENSEQKSASSLVQRSLNASEIVATLAKLEGWTLTGDGSDVAIEKTYKFPGYHETIAFVNAIVWIAHRTDHHPDLSVHYNRCVVRYATHSAGGITALDVDAAGQVDALLK
ncbi:MAG: 4a-hydroxytetrahydrobiopterin dehydratase [Burkholderiales bacterium]